MKKMKPYPKRFLWGAATSAHQVEGGNHNQWTVWELENAKTLAAQASYKDSHVPVWDEIKSEATRPENYVSGSLANHYTQYEHDFDYLQKMNMNAYRFSVEWSRIEPEEGSWNAEEVHHYKQYIAALVERGVEPVITLFHFSLPVWFSRMGGFEKRSNIKHFTRFAERIVRELGRDVKYVITVNEPEIYVQQAYLELHFPPQTYSRWKAWRTLHNLLAAHNSIAKQLHKTNRRYKVAIAKNSSYFYAGDDAWLSKLSAGLMQYFQDDYVIKKVVRNSDFIGVNYYFSNRVYGYRVHNENNDVSDLGWNMSPGDIEYALERVYDKHKKPIMVTENGVADKDDEYRKWWIAQTLAGMQRALDEGVELIGYLHWSLMDNSEWAYGRWPRFGLVEVDYKTGERTLRPSAVWFGKVIKKLRSDT